MQPVVLSVLSSEGGRLCPPSHGTLSAGAAFTPVPPEPEQLGTAAPQGGRGDACPRGGGGGAEGCPQGGGGHQLVRVAGTPRTLGPERSVLWPRGFPNPTLPGCPQAQPVLGRESHTLCGRSFLPAAASSRKVAFYGHLALRGSPEAVLAPLCSLGYLEKGLTCCEPPRPHLQMGTRLPSPRAVGAR